MPFIASLWAAILVALLCALAPDGPPSSKFNGSAFSSATTGVVLKARSLPAPHMVRAPRPDGDGAALPWLLAAALALMLSWRRLAPDAPLPLLVADQSCLRARSRRARAPPAFV
ncbi:hypothetical protein ACFSUK_29615 [Sphingobium scionense]|uniref:Uncharacterized protein n=1 Tax=Sphingobium scionense TaxID=1404341 RepID=A0A7W6LQN7_9SPHN|nr:hypothetical protein [Sphingobium scionense]MBB4147833.1 hypothetical protein [Sphingobium scionense]